MDLGMRKILLVTLGCSLPFSSINNTRKLVPPRSNARNLPCSVKCIRKIFFSQFEHLYKLIKNQMQSYVIAHKMLSAIPESINSSKI